MKRGSAFALGVALAAAGCKPSVASLEAKEDVSALASRARDPKDRVEAIGALGRVADRNLQAADEVMRLAEGFPGDATVDEAFRAALGRGAPWASDGVRIALHTPARLHATLSICGATDARCSQFLPELEAAIANPMVEDAPRDEALHLALALGDASAPALGRLLADLHEGVRARVVAALKELGEKLSRGQRDALYARLGDEPSEALAAALVELTAGTDRIDPLVSAVRRGRDTVAVHVTAVSRSTAVRCDAKQMVWMATLSALEPDELEHHLAPAATAFGKKCPAELHEALEARLKFPGGAASIAALSAAPEIVAALGPDDCPAIRDGLAPIEDLHTRANGQRLIGAVCEKPGR